LTRSLEAAIREVDPALSLEFNRLADRVDADMTRERLVAVISGAWEYWPAGCRRTARHE
jgi:hypothetical protein